MLVGFHWKNCICCCAIICLFEKFPIIVYPLISVSNDTAPDGAIQSDTASIPRVALWIDDSVFIDELRYSCWAPFSGFKPQRDQWIVGAVEEKDYQFLIGERKQR